MKDVITREGLAAIRTQLMHDVQMAIIERQRLAVEIMAYIPQTVAEEEKQESMLRDVMESIIELQEGLDSIK